MTVSWVYDGDTVKLADGRKVRLAGINTPEVAHGEQMGEPLGDDARIALSRMVEGKALGLRFDRERFDRYGRSLAHLFLEDGTSLEAELVERGLAFVMPVAPNEWHLDCYLGAERLARTAHRGIWNEAAYAVKRAGELGPDDQGFRLVRGRVERVIQAKSGTLLKLQGGVTLRLPEGDASDAARWAGREVVARGWVRYHNGRSSVIVPHRALVSTE